MTVLHITQGYFGSGLYQLLFSQLNENGIKNIIYIPQYEKINLKSTDNIIISENRYSPIERFLFFGKQNKSLREIEQKINLNRIDIIHAHNLYSGGYVAYKLSRKYNIPYIVTIRNTDVNVFHKYMIHLRRIGYKILSNSDKIIFISPSYRHNVISNWYNSSKKAQLFTKSVVIANGIDPYFLVNSITDKKVLEYNHIRIIYFGEITKNKNIITICKACQKLIAQGYDVKFDIIGEIYYSGFHKLIKHNPFVNYHPRCSKQDLIQKMKNSDIFVMTSIFETFGLVYTEAMSQGLPIVYSQGQGFDGFFEQGEVGYAVHFKDHLGVAKSILDIYKDYSNISKRCLIRVNCFDWKIIANQYIELYKKITIK